MTEKPVRVGPVHFQPLEWELAPVRQFLRGNVLNAGCGNRDIGSYLLGAGSGKLTNYDIASNMPEAILGSLETMPFADGQFDSGLCNAVLEHVASANNVIRELFRVIRPGGHLVVAVPFLQPFHECPIDMRRYTAEGLADLGEGVGFKTVSVLPVHSAAQTLGWIAWEIVQEKNSRLLRWISWPVIFLATRLSLRTDARILRNANTYQAVFLRP